MNVSPRLDLKLGQGLVLSPQMRQAFQLLQMSNLDVETAVEAELADNPLLVRGEEADVGERAEATAQTAEPPALEQVDVSPQDLHDFAPGDYATGDAAPDAPEAAVTAAAPQEGWLVEGSGRGAGEDFEIDRRGAEDSLASHLEAQLGLLRLDPADRMIAQVLIGSLDLDGYLRTAVAELADLLGCAPPRVASVLSRLQRLEPTGVFARDLGECLALQAGELGRLDPPMVALLERLDLVARRDHAGLCRLCGVDEDAVREMLAFVRGLNPRPGGGFSADAIQVAIADVIVSEDPCGGWRVEMNAETLPRVRLDSAYHAVVARGARTDADRAYLSDRHASASWLVKNLDQRVQTILKVVSEIVRRQQAFMAFGVERLRPMTLRNVADAVGLHESTVSRAIAGKYVSTPRGLFDLKFFFTAALADVDGGSARSAESVRRRLKQLVEAEKRGAYGDAGVLTDDRLVEMLRQEGVSIARRTVTKYRERLRIPPASERRRQLLA